MDSLTHPAPTEFVMADCSTEPQMNTLTAYIFHIQLCAHTHTHTHTLLRAIHRLYEMSRISAPSFIIKIISHLLCPALLPPCSSTLPPTVHALRWRDAPSKTWHATSPQIPPWTSTRVQHAAAPHAPAASAAATAAQMTHASSTYVNVLV